MIINKNNLICIIFILIIFFFIYMYLQTYYKSKVSSRISSGISNNLKKENFLSTGEFGYFQNVNRIRISTDTPYLTITGFFAYDANGNLINLSNIGSPIIGSIYLENTGINKWDANGVLKWIPLNMNRRIDDALNTTNNINNNFGLNLPSAGFPVLLEAEPSRGAFTFNSFQSSTGYYNTIWNYTFNNPMNISCVEFMGRKDCCNDRLNYICELIDINNNIIARQISGSNATVFIPSNQSFDNLIHNVFVADPTIIPINQPSYGPQNFLPIKSFFILLSNYYIPKQNITQPPTVGNTTQSQTVGNTTQPPTVGNTTTTAGNTTTTSGNTTTTAGNTTTTSGNTTTTSGNTTTTSGNTTTTSGNTTTTSGNTTTTSGNTTVGNTSTTSGNTTVGNTSTTSGNTTVGNTTQSQTVGNTTQSQTVGNTIDNNISMPTMPTMPTIQTFPSNLDMLNIPMATPVQITDLIDKGLGVELLTRNGILMNQQYKGPSTNILQTDFTGTSNIYSPFLFYNKGSTEKFIGVNKIHPEEKFFN